MGAFLRPEGFDGPRGLRALTREGSAALEAGRLLRRSAQDRRERRARPYASGRPGGNEPILLIPGFMAGDSTLSFMSRFLRRNGYRTYRSGFHMNVGCTQEAGERLEHRLEQIVNRRGRKVTIIGHSLGGMMARGGAARRPDLVEAIITLGSPVLAPGAVHDLLAWDTELLARLSTAGFAGLMSADCLGGDCARHSFDEMQEPLAAGIDYTAIYSRRDGIVDWRACLDPAADRHIEVTTSHCGMAIDPVVFDHVLGTLSARRASLPAARPGSEGLLHALST